MILSAGDTEARGLSGGVLHVAFARSDQACGTLRRIEVSGSLEQDRVLGPFVLSDLGPSVRGLPFFGGFPPLSRLPPATCLARGVVRYEGEPMAVVLADSIEGARDALARIRCDIESRPSVSTIADALAPGAPSVHEGDPPNVAFEWTANAGDWQAVAGAADRIFECSFDLPRFLPAGVAPRRIEARFLPESRVLEVRVTSSAPHSFRGLLAGALGLEESSIHVAGSELVGTDGLDAWLRAEDVAVCALALRLAPRRLLWTEDAIERELAAPRRPASRARARLAVRRDGRILGLAFEGLIDLGAHAGPVSPIVPEREVEWMRGPYSIPVVDISWKGLYTNAVPALPLSAGRVEYALALESLVDSAARALELDPVELRRGNLVGPSAEPKGGVRPRDAADPRRALDALAEHGGLEALRDVRRDRRRRGELVGLGIALHSFAGAPGPSEVLGRDCWEAATVRVGPTGDVEVLAGLVDHGQGLASALASVAGRALGIEPGKVRLTLGDTRVGPRGAGGGGGRAFVIGGSAVLSASRVVASRMRRVAGVLLGRPEEYVEREGEAFRSGDAAVTWREVCYEAYHPRLDFETLGLDSTAYYEPEDSTHAPGACLAFVSVDAECGRVRIERLLAIHDAGRVVNLAGVETVLRRGVLEGVDFSLSERIRLDDGRSSVVGGGRALAPWVECRVVETPCPLHPLEARPVAQAGFVASVPAIALAVLDALESVGVRGGSPPWTPERVWRRIRESAGACP